jgi:hypothetical protein
VAIHYHVLLSKRGLEVNLGDMWVEDNFFWSLCSNLCVPGAGCRFKRLTGRHDVQIYESDYKYFAARVKHRRAPQHSLSSMPVLSPFPSGEPANISPSTLHPQVCPCFLFGHYWDSACLFGSVSFCVCKGFLSSKKQVQAGKLGNEVGL